MSDCSDVLLGSKLVVLMKKAIEPMKKSELLKLLGFEHIEKSKQNQFKDQLNNVLKTAVNLGFVQVINDHYMAITHTVDIADMLGFDIDEYGTSSTSLTGMRSESSEIYKEDMEMGSKLILCLSSINEPIKKDKLMFLMGLDTAEESKASNIKIEIEKVLDEAVNCGFIQSVNEHYMPATHARDVAELLDMTENEYRNGSSSSMLNIVTDNNSYDLVDVLADKILERLQQP